MTPDYKTMANIYHNSLKKYISCCWMCSEIAGRYALWLLSGVKIHHSKTVKNWRHKDSKQFQVRRHCHNLWILVNFMKLLYHSRFQIQRFVLPQLGQERETERHACVGHDCVCRTWSRRKEAGYKAQVMHDLLEKSKEGQKGLFRKVWPKRRQHLRLFRKWKKNSWLAGEPLLKFVSLPAGCQGHELWTG